MAGTYTEGVSKVLSGVYTLIQAALQSVTRGARGTVAYPFTSNWGPVNVLEPVTRGGEFDGLYNAKGTDLTAKKISFHAFKGRPQLVLSYRMAKDAAKGTATLESGLKLETLYPSDRPFTAVVKDGVADGAKVIEIVENGRLLAKAEGTTIEQLVQQLNVSDFVRVVEPGTGLPANTAGVDFAGGNNGATVTTQEYTEFLNEVEADGRANAFSLDGVTDAAIIAMVEEWTKRVRQEGLYLTFVNGGPIEWDTDPAAANDKSKAFNFRGILNVGNGVDGYSAAEMAIFIAARAASVPLNRTLTDEVIDYVKVNKKLRPGQRETAKQAGTIVFVHQGDAVVIDEGVNTLTTPGDGEVIEFGKIRVNNALDQIARDLEAFGNEYKRTRSNTQEARETYAATVENVYLAGMAAMAVTQEGYFYRPDPEYHGPDAVHRPKIDEAFFHMDVTPVDSMERIYQKIGVNF